MSYGQEGKAFPVQVGETWQVGRHTFRCGDLRHCVPPPFDVLYSDPPWNNSLLTAFHTRAGLGKPDYDWRFLYRRIIELAPPGTPIWLEGGVKECDEIVALMPGAVVDWFPITYYRTRPCVLIYSGEEPPPIRPLGDDDEILVEMLLRAYGETGTVFDACSGRGLTSRAAEAAGWSSINNELNPARLSASLARLQRQTKLTPVLL